MHPSAINGKDSNGGKKKRRGGGGNSRRDLPGEKLPRLISHGQLPRRYSPNIDQPRRRAEIDRRTSFYFLFFFTFVKTNRIFLLFS